MFFFQGGWTAMHRAAKEGFIDTTKLILKDPRFTEVNSWTKVIFLHFWSTKTLLQFFSSSKNVAFYQSHE